MKEERIKSRKSCQYLVKLLVKWKKEAKDLVIRSIIDFERKAFNMQIKRVRQCAKKLTGKNRISRNDPETN